MSSMKKVIKLAIIGDSKSGKSEYIKKYSKSYYSSEGIINVIITEIEGKNLSSSLIEVKESLHHEKFDCILLFTEMSKLTKESMMKLINKKYKMFSDTPFIFCGTKNDLKIGTSIKDFKKLSKIYQSLKIEMEDFPIFSISSITNYDTEKPILMTVQKKFGPDCNFIKCG